jgi:RHS repeat-associated protein
MRSMLLILSALALTVAHVDAPAATGRTPGAFDVTSTGEATYAIPIAAPPGVRGLTPQLALTYASRSRQSIAGYGWNISGAMAITRCPNTVAQDGIARGVTNSLQDRFCLDGNKLRLVSGTYGQGNSEYRTEIETFSRIKAYGTAGNGPAYFIMEGKDGLIYEFGNTTDSRILSKGKTTARSWALNRVRDRDNNEIKYQYIRDLYGAYRLDLVTYAGNAQQGTTAIYSIDLVYESRPQEEVRFTFFGGADIREYNRLDRIDVLYDGTTLYRRYDLTYEPALSAAKRSRLASVLECAGAGPECLPPTTFVYEDSPGLNPETDTGTVVPVTSALPLDVNGDGRDDLVYPNGTGPWMVMFANSSGGYDTPINTLQPSTGSSGAIPFDYDADGHDDLLVPYSGGTWWVLFGSGSGLGAPQDTGAAATGTGVNARALDVDGDGQDDLVWADLTSPAYAGGDAIRWRRKVPGGGFSATAEDLVAPVSVNQEIPSGIFAGWAERMQGRIPDFNGDGRDDLVYRKYIRQRIDGTPNYHFMYRLVVNCPGVTDCLTSAAGVASEPYFGDFNDDGLTDLLYYDDDGAWKYRFSTGTGFESPLSAGTLDSYSDAMIVDYDGDGFEDILMNHFSTSTWHFLRSTGEVLLPPVPTGQSSAGTNSHVVTDMNGDGLRELAYRGSGDTWHYKARPVTLDLQDQLVTATDGFGLAVTFSYAPLTLASVYTKGSGASYPRQEVQDAIWVVNGLTATDASGTGSTFTLTFSYDTGRLDLPGRGFLGFAKRTVVDSRLGYNLKTIETYEQSFPYIGALTSVERQQSNGTRISLATNTWDNLSWGTAGSTELRFPYVRVHAVDHHELNGTKFRTITSTVASGGVDATSGLILDSTIVTTDMIASTSKTERVLYTSPLNDTTNWCIGRPTDIAITKSHTLPNGAAITRSFDATWDGAKCRPTQQRVEPDDPAWRVTVDLGYDSFGNVNSRTVTGGGVPTPMLPRTTLIDWGTRGHFPHSLTNALNEVTQQTWNDGFGRPATLTDPNGLQTSWTYDNFSRPATQVGPDGTKKKWLYGSVCSNCGSKYRYHVQVDETDASNNLIRRRYSYLTQWDQVFLERVRLLNAEYSVVASRDFDARGRMLKQFVPYIDGQADEGSRRWTYDLLDRVSTDGLYTAAGAMERQTSYAYSGLTSTVTDPLNHATSQTLAAWGDVLSMTDARSGVTSHQYNAFGELKQTTDAANNVVATVSYIDVRGFRTELNDRNLRKWTFVPNALGEIVSQKDAKGQTSGQQTTFEYDLLGRMMQRIEPDATSQWTWGTSAALDEIGRLKKVTGPGYIEDLEYDTVGRLKKRIVTLEGTAHQFDFTYNSIGELYTVTYPTSTASPRFKLKYDYANGYLTTIREFTGDVDNTTFWALNQLNARGQAVDEAYGNGLWLQSHFKPLTGEMDTRQSGTGGSATNVQNLSYVWDTAGNMKERHDLRQALSETVDYDELNRMWRTVGPAGTFTFDYDAVGNLQSRSDVDSSGAWTYSRTATSITWTSANLPATISNGSITAQFTYAPDRSRWRQVADYAGGAETTLYIGGLLEKHTSPVRTHWKHLIATPSGEVQHVRRSDGTTDTLYLPSDHLGSVDAVLDASATILVRTSFDAWGGRRDDSWVGAPSASEYQQIANTTRHGFAGQEMLDNVGLVHMNGRVYEPASGRMLSADPFVVPMLGSQGFNRYAYVGNQPLTYVDPSGFNPIDPNDPDDGGDFHFCIGFCGGSYIGDRGGPWANPNGPRKCPGWCVPDGDMSNNMRNGGPEERERFTASVTADHTNVSTVGGTCGNGSAPGMCHTYAPTGQRIDGARFLTETFVPGAYYFNLAAEADAQRRHFTAFGLYLAGNAEFVLTVLSAGTGAAFTVPGRAPAVTRMVNPRSLISRQGRD